MNLEPVMQSELSSLPFKPGRPDAPGSPGAPLRPCEPFKAIQKSVFLLSTQDLPSFLPPPFPEPLLKTCPFILCGRYGEEGGGHPAEGKVMCNGGNAYLW